LQYFSQKNLKKHIIFSKEENNLKAFGIIRRKNAGNKALQKRKRRRIRAQIRLWAEQIFREL
jgi:hypothetical protein